MIAYAAVRSSGIMYPWYNINVHNKSTVFRNQNLSKCQNIRLQMVYHNKNFLKSLLQKYRTPTLTVTIDRVAKCKPMSCARFTAFRADTHKPANEIAFMIKVEILA